MVSPVSVWTALGRGHRAGWTVSSFLVADGEPGEVVGVVDEDSDLADLLTHPQAQPAVVVNLLSWEQRSLADAFAGQAPAPGGVFRLGEWTESEWGPVLLGSAGWIGARLAAAGVTTCALAPHGATLAEREAALTVAAEALTLVT